MRLLVFGLVLAAAVALIWPGSKAGQAVVAVTGSLSSALTGI